MRGVGRAPVMDVKRIWHAVCWMVHPKLKTGL